MTFVQNLWRDLVDKRLWPVAVALIVALVAVPVLIGSGSSSSPTSSLGTATPSGTDTTPSPVAQVALDTSTPSKQIDRTGAVRNPFKALHVLPADKTAATGPATPATTPPATSTSTNPSSSTKPTTTSPTPSPTTTPHTFLFDWQTSVRIGSHTSMKTHKVRGVTLLPSSTYVLLTYIGVKKDHKTAVFNVSQGTLVTGGKCLPTPVNCAILELGIGKSALLTRRAGATGLKRYRVRNLGVKLHKLSVSTSTAKAARKQSTLELAAGSGITG